MKWTRNFGLRDGRLYAVCGHGLWEHHLEGRPPTQITVSHLAYETNPNAEVALQGLTVASDFILSPLRYRKGSPKDSPRKVESYGKALRVLKFPVDSLGTLKNPVDFPVGPHNSGFYPIAIVGHSLLAGTDSELAAFDLDNPREAAWPTVFRGWRRSVLPISSGEVYVSAVEPETHNSGLWRIRDGLAQPVALPSGWTILAMDTDSSGSIWAGVHRKNESPPYGLASLRTAGWDFSAAPPSKLNRDIQDIAIAMNGAAWCASLDNGIVRYHHGDWKVWKLGDGIGSNTHSDALVDPSGTIWFWGGESIDRVDTSDTPACAWRHPLND